MADESLVGRDLEGVAVTVVDHLGNIFPVKGDPDENPRFGGVAGVIVRRVRVVQFRYERLAGEQTCDSVPVPECAFAGEGGDDLRFALFGTASGALQVIDRRFLNFQHDFIGNRQGFDGFQYLKTHLPQSHILFSLTKCNVFITYCILIHP